MRGQLSRRLPVPCRFRLPPCLFPDRTGASAACRQKLPDGAVLLHQLCRAAAGAAQTREAALQACISCAHQTEGRIQASRRRFPPALPVPGMAEQGKARRGLSPQPVPNSGHAGKRTRPGRAGSSVVLPDPGMTSASFPEPSAPVSRCLPPLPVSGERRFLCCRCCRFRHCRFRHCRFRRCPLRAAEPGRLRVPQSCPEAGAGVIRFVRAGSGIVDVRQSAGAFAWLRRV